MRLKQSRLLLLILIILLGILLRGGLLLSALTNLSITTPDSKEYTELACSIYETGSFERNGKPEIFRTPGYPVFLSVFLWPSAPWGAILLVLMILGLEAGFIYLVFRMGRFLIDSRVGLLGALFQAVSPLAMGSCARFLSDSLYAFVFTLGLLLMIHHLRNGRWGPLVAAAGAIAVGCYIRPVGLVMGALFMLVLLFCPKRFRRAGVFAAILVGCLAPWVVRNAITADYYGFSSFASDSLYYTSAAETLARKQNVSSESMRQKFRDDEEKYTKANPDETIGAGVNRRGAEGRRIILSNPGLYFQSYVGGCIGFWFPSAPEVLELAGLTEGQRGTVDVFQRKGLWAAIQFYFGGEIWPIILTIPLVLITLIKYIGVVICFTYRTLLHLRPEVYLPVLVVIVSAFLPSPGLPRYRLPISGILSIAAATGILIALGRLPRTAQDRSLNN